VIVVERADLRDVAREREEDPADRAEQRRHDKEGDEPGVAGDPQHDLAPLLRRRRFVARLDVLVVEGVHLFEI
jgi:hypothetical protein